MIGVPGGASGIVWQTGSDESPKDRAGRLALVVSGRISHAHLQPDALRGALEERLPRLTIGIPDFFVERDACRVEFFCNSTTTLDYTIALKSGSSPAPAAVALLVRETDSINAVIISTLGKSGRAQVEYCLLEDDRSRTSLLSWSPYPAPLKSRPAKVSYLICLALLLLGFFLICQQFQQPHQPGMEFNILSLALTMGLPALTLPLPFLFEHLRNVETARWVFSGGNGGARP